jgi:RHS repeat-associated protein
MRVNRVQGPKAWETVQYGYLPAGNLKSVDSIAGDVQYQYDAGERLVRIEANGTPYDYEYEPQTGVLSKELGPVLGWTAQHNLMDQPVLVSWSQTGSGAEVDRLAYVYTPHGLVQRVTRKDGRVREYGYDGLDRLVLERHYDVGGTLERDATYAYDLAGNRTETVIDGTTTTYTCGNGNRLNAWTGGSYAFDAAGNVVTRQVGSDAQQLQWNAQYQLTTVLDASGEVEVHMYDVQGRRVWTARGSETNRYVYNGAQVVADVDATGALVRTYVWGPGVDNLLAMSVHQGSVTTTYHTVRDHLGSVLSLVDETGAVVEQYEYDAWGNVLAVKDGAGNPLTSDLGHPTSALGNRYLWQGREYSWKTGLYYFRARWYDPVTGRFISKDPSGIVNGLNEYVALNNNPVNFVDPTGEAAIEAHAYWSGVAVSGQDAGGVLGNLQTAGASVMMSFIDFWGTRALENNASLSGQYSTSDECQGNAWKHGLLAGGQIALSAASAFGGNNAVHPFYRFVGPGSRPGIGAGTWLARGTRGSIPYGNIENAISRLQIPPESQVNAVMRVRNVWWRYIAGPRPASGNPAWGAGGGLEYRIGGF